MSAKGGNNRSLEETLSTARQTEPGPVQLLPGWSQALVVGTVVADADSRAAKKAAERVAKEVIDEVLVTSKYVPVPQTSLLPIGRLFGAMSLSWNVLGIYALGKALAEFAEIWNDEINIAVASVDQQVTAALDAALQPPDEFTVTQPMEHVLVTAPSLASPKLSVDAALQVLPQPAKISVPVITPDFFPNPEFDPEMYPIPRPQIQPVTVPAEVPTITQPFEMPNISPKPGVQSVPQPYMQPGSITVQPSTQFDRGIQIKVGPKTQTWQQSIAQATNTGVGVGNPTSVGLGPAMRQPEPNRPRADRKAGSARAMMRAIYTLWGSTFGVVTEVLDLYEALSNSTFIWYHGGYRRLSSIPNGWELFYLRLIHGDRYHIDYERFLLSFYTMQIMDSVVGRLTGGTREYNRRYGNRMALIKYGLPPDLLKETEKAMGKEFAKLFDMVYYEYVHGNTPFYNTRYRKTGQRISGYRRKWTRGRRSVLKHKRFSNRT